MNRHSSLFAIVTLVVAVGLLFPLPAWAGRSEMPEDVRYSRQTVIITPLRTETIVDEIWLDSLGRWRLERSSGTWDDGLIAVNDGEKLTVSLPELPVSLHVSAQTELEFASPLFFRKRPAMQEFRITGQETAFGHQAVLMTAKSDDYEVRRWLQKDTMLPLREERFDKDGRLTLLVARREANLETVDFDLDWFKLVADRTTDNVDEWRHQAILTWLQKKVPFRLKIVDPLPSWIRIEWAGLIKAEGGLTAVLVTKTQNELVSVWVSQAGDEVRTRRALLALGRTVIHRRVGDTDVYVVSSNSRLALAFFRAAFAQ